MNKEEKQIDLISCKRGYQGVGFIKSRKSKFAVMSMAEDMIKMACANSIEIKSKRLISGWISSTHHTLYNDC